MAILCGIAIAATYAATLWPFDFFRVNGVSWLPDNHGIHFSSAGIILADKPLGSMHTGPQNSCSIEISLRPARVESAGTILGIYKPNNPRQLLIRQLNDGLLISRDIAIANGRDSIRTVRLDVSHVFQAGKPIFLTLTSGSNGTILYSDGAQPRVFPGFSISAQDLTGQLVLGTSPVRYHPWLGDVMGLAIYSKQLAPEEVLRNYKAWNDVPRTDPQPSDGTIARYSFTEGMGNWLHNDVVSGPDLEIPQRLKIPHKPFLQSPTVRFEANWYYAHDLLLNIAGFAPLGFFLCVYWSSAQTPRRALIYSIVIGALLSFSIEVLQAYVPERDSGVTDIITNTLGTFCGAALARSSIVRTVFSRTTFFLANGSLSSFKKLLGARESQ